MNSDDYISHEPWSDDYLANVYIRYMDFDEQISVPLCYRKEDLLRFFEPLNMFMRHGSFRIPIRGYI